MKKNNTQLINRNLYSPGLTEVDLLEIDFIETSLLLVDMDLLLAFFCCVGVRKTVEQKKIAFKQLHRETVGTALKHTSACSLVDIEYDRTSDGCNYSSFINKGFRDDVIQV